MCKRPCDNRVDDLPQCCDGIFLPSFVFSNALGFADIRPSRIVVTPDGEVLWEIQVHGTYFQSMNLRHHPFDSLACLVDIKLVDTSSLDMGSVHPGIKLKPSSVGNKVRVVGVVVCVGVQFFTRAVCTWFPVTRARLVLATRSNGCPGATATTATGGTWSNWMPMCTY